MDNFIINHINILKNNFANPELELKILLKNSSFKKTDIIFSNFKIKEINLEKFNNAFKRRVKREPISKIFNVKSFWKYDFIVNENVLDPRPDTELIIEQILYYFPNKNKSLKILDMFTGSGCLAISIAKEYSSSLVTGTDISSKAIKIAKANAINLNCAHQINFIKCNIINTILKYDIIVANPPYLSDSEYMKTSKEIQLFEPKIAFIAAENGYAYYKRISNI